MSFMDGLSGLIPKLWRYSLMMRRKSHSTASIEGPGVGVMVGVEVGVSSLARCLLSWLCLTRIVVTITPMRMNAIAPIKINFFFTLI